MPATRFGRADAGRSDTSRQTPAVKRDTANVRNPSSSWSTLVGMVEMLVNVTWEKSGIFDMGFLLLFMKYVMAALVSGQVFNYIRGVHPFGVKGEDAFVVIYPDTRSQFLAESYVAAACFWFCCNSFICLLEIGGEPLPNWTTKTKTSRDDDNDRGRRQRSTAVHGHLAVIFTSMAILQSMSAVKMSKYPLGIPALLKWIWEDQIAAY